MPRMRGNSASQKQIDKSVLEGRAVAFTTTVGLVTGYVVGADDYTWVVSAHDGTVSLVHKTCPLVTLGQDTTIDLHPEAERLAAAYKAFIEKERT